MIAVLNIATVDAQGVIIRPMVGCDYTANGVPCKHESYL